MPPRKLQGEDLFLFFGLSSFLILFASVATQSFPAQVSSPSFLVFDWPVACIRGRALFFSEISAEPGAPAGYSARRQSTEGSRRIFCVTAVRPRVMSSHQIHPSFFSVRVSNALFSFSRLCPNPILPPQVSFAQARTVIFCKIVGRPAIFPWARSRGMFVGQTTHPSGITVPG